MGGGALIARGRSYGEILTICLDFIKSGMCSFPLHYTFLWSVMRKLRSGVLEGESYWHPESLFRIANMLFEIPKKMFLEFQICYLEFQIHI